MDSTGYLKRRQDNRKAVRQLKHKDKKNCPQRLKRKELSSIKQRELNRV